MELRHILPAMEPDSVARIDQRLSDICADHHVAIPLAVESGSRAWGFPSPDSDYDCRFFFITPASDYITPWPKRDVIETPLEGELDVNGWDLRKALRLLIKGNAVVIEWLVSPVVYRGDAVFRIEFLALARRHADRNRIASHYLHLGERQRRADFGDGKAVPLKKIFYALRPAAALRWLRIHPEDAIAPMHFPTLISACDVPGKSRNWLRRFWHERPLRENLARRRFHHRLRPLSMRNSRRREGPFWDHTHLRTSITKRSTNFSSKLLSASHAARQPRTA